MKVNHKKKILIYGAGAIGRGFLPWIFSPEDFEYYYVERDDKIRNSLERDKHFVSLKTVKNNNKNLYDILEVPIVKCFSPGEEIKSINTFDAIITAVGPRNILSLANSLKDTKMPIICCENDSSIPVLLQSVIDNPNIVFAIPDVISSNTASDKIKKKYALSIITEDGVCYIDKRVSKIGGKVNYVSKEELEKQWKAKLYLHNTPHCIAAYLGSFLKVKYVHEAMSSPRAREIISGAMHEMQGVLLKKFNLNKKFVTSYANKELGRFGNKLLFDPISRVAREPFRKLAPRERLLGAAQLCLSVGIYPKNIMLGIMAAFFYNNNDDPDSNIQYLVRTLDTADFLKIVTLLTPDQALYQLLLETWNINRATLKKIHG
jgi:mannitol-1-phosphate/altronate dehydrogenase